MVGQGDCLKSEPRKLVGACDTVAALQIVCAWCQQHIRWQRVQTPMPLQTSYGICPACLMHVSRALRVMAPDTPQTASEPCTLCRAGHAVERSIAPMSEDTPQSPVSEELQPVSGEALLQRIRDNRLQAHVIKAAARAACQRAKEVRECARHSNTLACAACVVRRYLITRLHRHSQRKEQSLTAAFLVRKADEDRWRKEKGA